MDHVKEYYLTQESAIVQSERTPVQDPGVCSKEIRERLLVAESVERLDFPHTLVVIRPTGERSDRV